MGKNKKAKQGRHTTGAAPKVKVGDMRFEQVNGMAQLRIFNRSPDGHYRWMPVDIDKFMAKMKALREASGPPAT